MLDITDGNFINLKRIMALLKSNFLIGLQHKETSKSEWTLDPGVNALWFGKDFEIERSTEKV